MTPEQTQRLQVPGAIVRRDVFDHYTLIEESPAGYLGFNFDRLIYLETRCAGKCETPFRMDAHHPEYAEVKAALDRGNREVIFCYHKRRV